MKPLDGGYKSRKLMLAGGTSVGIVAGAVLCHFMPTIIPLYGTLVNGLVGVLVIYSGANVGSAALLKKKAAVPTQDPE